MGGRVNSVITGVEEATSAAAAGGGVHRRSVREREIRHWTRPPLIHHGWSDVRAHRKAELVGK